MTSAPGPRSVAANGSIGIAITGDDSSVTVLNLPEIQSARDIPAPPGAGNLPGDRPDQVIGRSEELRQLRELLTGQSGAAVTQRQAVHGLGGVGKSTLARLYAHTYRGDYTVVWWINATSRAQIDAALADLAAHLNPTLATTTRPDQRTVWAMSWLQWHPGWLLIYDNVEDPQDLLSYFGALPGGHHLATSRKATGWHNVAPTLTLGVLAPQAAADLLCNLAFEGPPTDQQRRATEALAADLGHLPLALEQAGAYLRQTGSDVAGYRDSLNLMLDQAAEGFDPQRTIACIWSMTLRAITDRNELAVTVLHTLAWLDPADCPRTLLAPLAAHTIDLDSALGLLNAYSMVSFNGPAVNVHRLVQLVLRADPRGRGTAEQVLVHAVYPKGRDNGPDDAQLRALLPHVFALAGATPPGSQSGAQIQLYTDAAEYLNQQGERGRALPLQQAVLADRELVLGNGHADTIASRDDAAFGYSAAGDLPQAIALLEENLQLRERLLGPMDPQTVINRRNVGGRYRDAGDLERAIPLLETALKQSLEVLGATDADALFSWVDLALAYQYAGDFGTAIDLFEIVLTQRIMALGEFHMDTLGTYQYLAHAYLQAENVWRAMTLFETTLAGCERSLGPTHWATLTSRDNLAFVYQYVGELRQAITLLHVNVACREETAGATHPTTLSDRVFLALCYEQAGEARQAIERLDAALADYERTLGETDHQTLTARDHLAGVCYRAGDLARAVQLYEANREAAVRTLGLGSDAAVGSEIGLIAAQLALRDSRRPLRRLLSLFRRGRGGR